MMYRTSKAAVNMAMRARALQLAPRGIVVAVINPGWVRTDMGGPGASISPEESVTAMRKHHRRADARAEPARFLNWRAAPTPGRERLAPDARSPPVTGGSHVPPETRSRP